MDADASTYFMAAVHYMRITAFALSTACLQFPPTNQGKASSSKIEMDDEHCWNKSPTTSSSNVILLPLTRTSRKVGFIVC